jgi:glycosyltransferase involved in cell wall biosynthesis
VVRTSRLAARQSVMHPIYALLYRAYAAAPPWVHALWRRATGKWRRPIRDLVVARAFEVPDKLAAPPSTWPNTHRSRPTEAQRGFGVTVVGYVHGEFGIAENLRLLVRSLDAARIPLEICDVKWPDPRNHGHKRKDPRLTTRPSFPVQIYCFNADQIPLLPVYHGARFLEGKYRIGYWYWELPNFPSAWESAFSVVDEVWVSSSFTRDAIARVSPRPVTRVALPVDIRLPRVYSRSDFGLPESVFLFLFSFDLNSFVARKNPHACIHAFRKAFSSHPQLPVGLVIKLMHGESYPDVLRELLAHAKLDPRIHVLDAIYSRDDAYGLTSVCDCFVSLHRAEGFGLGLAEAMRLGKPAIATGYSGNMDFTREQNACLIGYHLVPVREGEYPHRTGQVWAEPDIEEAAEHMWRTYSDPTFRARIAAAGQQFVEKEFSRRVAAEQVGKRLEEIRQTFFPEL